MSYETLKKQVKSDKLQNMFHFFGEEVYLKQHYLGILKEKLSGEFPEFNLIEFEGEVTSQDIDVSFNTPPMMGDKKLVIFRDTGIFKAGSKCKDAFKDAVENAADYLYVIVYDDEFDKRNAAYKAFAAKCLSVNFERRGRADIKAWVINLLKKGRKMISVDAMEYFLDCVGVDMYGVLTDVNKLISYMGERDKIEKEDVEKVITKEFFTKESFRNLLASSNLSCFTVIGLYCYLFVSLSCSSNPMNTTRKKVKNQIVTLKIDGIIIFEFKSSALNLNQSFVADKIVLVSLNGITLFAKFG